MDSGTSFVVLAPHCDDETLAAAGLLTIAAEQSIPVRIVMMTNGDGFNRYALGSQHRRLQPTPGQYIQFAYRRQLETLKAALQMGLAEGDVTFLGYPDRGLAAMWDEYWDSSRPYRSRFTRVDRSPYHNSFTPEAPFYGRSVVDDLKAVLRDSRPSHIITSHPHDAHSDHWATYCFALYALEELAKEGERFAEQVHILAYLTHRGRWPRPGGYHPRLPLYPPRHYQYLPFPWVTVDLPPDTVANKHRTLLAYQSQLRYMRGYLMSFVRRNELFGLFTALMVPRSEGADGALSPSDGPRDRSRRWSGAHCEVLDAVPATWVGRVQRGGDIRSVQATRDDGFLYLRMNLGAHASRELRYAVTLYGVSHPSDPEYPVRNRLQVEVRIPDQVSVSADGNWRGRTGWVDCYVQNRQLEVAIPLDLLQYPDRIFMGVETRYGRLILDQIAWQMLVLADGAEREIPHLADEPTTRSPA